jgi:hypothetical protein
VIGTTDEFSPPSIPIDPLRAVDDGWTSQAPPTSATDTRSRPEPSPWSLRSESADSEDDEPGKDTVLPTRPSVVPLVNPPISGNPDHDLDRSGATSRGVPDKEVESLDPHHGPELGIPDGERPEQDTIRLRLILGSIETDTGSMETVCSARDVWASTVPVTTPPDLDPTAAIPLGSDEPEAGLSTPTVPEPTASPRSDPIPDQAVDRAVVVPFVDSSASEIAVDGDPEPDPDDTRSPTGLKPSEVRARRRRAGTEHKTKDIGLADLLAEAMVIYEIARIHDDELKADPLAVPRSEQESVERPVQGETPQTGTLSDESPSVVHSSIFDKPLEPWRFDMDTDSAEDAGHDTTDDSTRDRMWIPPSAP